MHQVYLCKSVSEESARDAQCVVAAQLQHGSSIVIYVSTIMSANHIPSHTCLAPDMSIEVSKKDCEFVKFNPFVNFDFNLCWLNA